MGSIDNLDQCVTHNLHFSSKYPMEKLNLPPHSLFGIGYISLTFREAERNLTLCRFIPQSIGEVFLHSSRHTTAGVVLLAV